MSSEVQEIVGTETVVPSSALTAVGVVPIDVEKAAGSDHDVEIVQAVEARKEDDKQGTGKAKVVKGDDNEKKDTRKQMASRSEMWNHFEKFMINGVLQKGKCKYCKSDINAHTTVNGTSALRKHFNICKRNPHRNIGDDKQAVLQYNQGDSVNTWKYDPDAIRDAFVEMMIEDELPFAFCEKAGFRKFMSVACPRFLVPSRRTCTRDIVGKYFEEKAKLKLFFKEHCERVCLTTDCWSSQQKDSYMTVTAHFICKDWKLHKKVIGLFNVKSHKGDDIAKYLQKTLIGWGIEKVMTITVDNASNNDGGIGYMKKEVNKAKT